MFKKISSMYTHLFTWLQTLSCSVRFCLHGSKLNLWKCRCTWQKEVQLACISIWHGNVVLCSRFGLSGIVTRHRSCFTLGAAIACSVLKSQPFRQSANKKYNMQRWLLIFKQECIPVGCVPSAAMAVLGGVCLGGVCLGECLSGGVCWQTLRLGRHLPSRHAQTPPRPGGRHPLWTDRHL